MEDEDVYNDIPSDWWLSPDSKGRLLLSCMVHRKNKEIAPLCTGHKRGKNRVSQRKEKDARIQKERDDDREERLKGTWTTPVRSTNNVYRKMSRGWQSSTRILKQLGRKQLMLIR